MHQTRPVSTGWQGLGGDDQGNEEMVGVGGSTHAHEKHRRPQGLGLSTIDEAGGRA
ncbi:hypothetical protein L7F22_033631, partial [Adiantum nelumboides]|nr:hypothetical protein [Adiantum nelumboides]